jgi:hypothetical protein
LGGRVKSLGGFHNSLYGGQAGGANTTGNGNSFFGINTGLTNVTGSNNTLLGFQADVGALNLTNATAIGANANVSTSNSIVLGSINGVNGAAADTNVGSVRRSVDRLHVKLRQESMALPTRMAQLSSALMLAGVPLALSAAGSAPNRITSCFSSPATASRQ